MTETIPIPREHWNLIDPEGAVRATEDSCIKAWARINGYKPTVEGLLGYEQQGWRVRSALTQQAEGATQDEIIELVAALEIRAILEHIKTVAAIYPVDDMPTPFQSAWRGCCEEIFFLATGCQWHMSQDDGRRRVQGDTAGQKIIERALATSATPPSPSAEVTAELMRLYATDSVDKLVEAQEQYIQNLQVKLHAAKAAQPSGQDAEQAAMLQWLDKNAKEVLLDPRRAASEICPDLRTKWEIPTLICSGPIGGHVSFLDAIRAAMKREGAK